MSLTADDAFDRDGVHAGVAARHPDADVVVPPRSSAVPSEAAETAPTQRDAHLRWIAERGRMGWQRASGYNWRALVEADVSRWKRVIGDGLRSRTDGRQATEVTIAANVLNHMLELGRPAQAVKPLAEAIVGRYGPLLCGVSAVALVLNTASLSASFGLMVWWTGSSGPRKLAARRRRPAWAHGRAR